ncbi:MAG: aminoacyl-tRNA hydrolase [Bdellovibrionales bacterium]|nr:aminoacyl-tRNA hydrolase [Bdellovibrionales bacterium]
MKLVISDAISIPESELEFTYSRSSGPGGQNVNKVNTKAQLRWNVAATSALPDLVRARFLSKYATRISKDGVLLIQSSKFRDQKSNHAACVEKLTALVEAVLTPPKKRRRTKPSKAAVETRLQQKQRKGAKKKLRRSPTDH